MLGLLNRLQLEVTQGFSHSKSVCSGEFCIEFEGPARPSTNGL